MTTIKPLRKKIMPPSVPTLRDQVLAAIAHRETGHIPHLILCQPAMAQMLSRHYGTEDISPLLGNAVEWIGDRLTTTRLEHFGLLRNGEYTDEWGVRWFGVGETRGQVKRPPLLDPSLSGYRFPARLPQEVISQMQEQVAGSAGRYRVAKLGALWEQATFLRGMENLLVDVLLHPRFVHDLLDGILNVLLTNLELYRHELRGLDAIWLSDDYGSQAGLLMSPRLWRMFIAPRLHRISAAVHAAGFDFALHSDGAIADVLPDIVEIGVDLLHPVQSECVDVRWVKREFGKQITIWGGYGNQSTLVFGTPEEVRREVHALCDEVGAGGGFILSPGLSLMVETPLENALAFIEVATERG